VPRMGTNVRDRSASRARPLQPSDPSAEHSGERGRARERPNLPLEDALQLMHLYFEQGLVRNPPDSAIEPQVLPRTALET
jgi:hypothetical protein